MSRGYGARQLAIIYQLAQASGKRLRTFDLVGNPDSASETASCRRALLTLRRDGLIDDSEYYLGMRGRPRIIKLTGKGLDLARRRGWA